MAIFSRRTQRPLLARRQKRGFAGGKPAKTQVD
jgi:hypothetical protein